MHALHRFFLLPINHLLRQNSWATVRLAQHAGNTVLLRASNNASFVLAIGANGELQPTDPHAAPDVTIELPTEFIALLLNDRQSLFASAHLSGRAELAEALAFVLRNLRWDSEADLARFIGDIPARRLDQFARQSLAQTRDAAERSLDNLAEYLTHEAGLTLHPSDFADFTADRKTLEQKLGRLEHRLKQLAG